jgi:succinate dehydrogenase / fumarate reductase membrane anchor subunit
MKSFTQHYVLQRITACILLALVPWFLWKLFFLKDLAHLEIIKNVGNLYSALLLFIMLISGFYHGYLGIQTICIDYIPNQRSRVSIVFMVGAMFSILSVFGIFSLIQLVTA